MYLVKDVGKLMIEYLIDETSPGARTYCTACNKMILPEDERIVMRRTQRNDKAARAGLFFCGRCAGEVARTINTLLGEV